MAMPTTQILQRPGRERILRDSWGRPITDEELAGELCQRRASAMSFPWLPPLPMPDSPFLASSQLWWQLVAEVCERPVRQVVDALERVHAPVAEEGRRFLRHLQAAQRAPLADRS